MTNKKLPTISIKGKEYVMVKDRIIAFNEMYPNGVIFTEIVKNDAESVVCKAIVIPDSREQVRAFTGHSEAYREGQMADVPVEVAETSAVGRALAMLGIGIIESVASADEIVKSHKFDRTAVNTGSISQKQKDMIMSLCLEKGVKTTTEELDSLTVSEASKKIRGLMAIPSKQKSSSQEKSELDFVEDLEIPIINE